MSGTWPVAVVGGGLAGAAAALALARRGVRPLWIAPPRPETDRVGESLAPAANAVLAELGVSGLLETGPHRHSNATFSAWGGERLVERNAITQLEGPGWVLDRAGLERGMTERAAALAEVRTAPLDEGAREAAGWRLTLEGGEDLEAGFVLDATGRNALIGRRCSTLRRADQLIAACAFLDQADDMVEPTRATLIEAAEDGWWYAALLPGGRLALAWFTDPDLAPSELTRELDVWRRKVASTTHIRRWIEEAGFALAAPPRLHSAGTTWLEPCAGPGWAAVGDAAAAFDPLSSHGMTTALWSGRAAAEAVIEEMGGAEGRLEAYAGHVASGVATFLDQRARYYAAERRFAEAPFWARRLRATADLEA